MKSFLLLLLTAIAVAGTPQKLGMSHDFQVAGRRAINAINDEFEGISSTDPYVLLEECDAQRTNTTDAKGYKLLQNLYVFETMARLTRRANEAQAQLGKEPSFHAEDYEQKYQTCKKLADQSFRTGQVSAYVVTHCKHDEEKQ